MAAARCAPCARPVLSSRVDHSDAVGWSRVFVGRQDGACVSAFVVLVSVACAVEVKSKKTKVEGKTTMVEVARADTSRTFAPFPVVEAARLGDKYLPGAGGT